MLIQNYDTLEDDLELLFPNHQITNYDELVNYLLDKKVFYFPVGIVWLYEITEINCFIGGLIYPEYRNQGKLQNYLKSVINWVWENTNIQRITMTCISENFPAQHIANDCLDMELEGVLRKIYKYREIPVDFFIYCLRRLNG